MAPGTGQGGSLSCWQQAGTSTAPWAGPDRLVGDLVSGMVKAKKGGGWGRGGLCLLGALIDPSQIAPHFPSHPEGGGSP